MTVPTFSRVEIKHDSASDLVAAEKSLRLLADELRKIASSITDEKMMKLAAHAAIQETSQKLRGTKR